MTVGRSGAWDAPTPMRRPTRAGPEALLSGMGCGLALGAPVEPSKGEERGGVPPCERAIAPGGSARCGGVVPGGSCL